MIPSCQECIFNSNVVKRLHQGFSLVLSVLPLSFPLPLLSVSVAQAANTSQNSKLLSATTNSAVEQSSTLACKSSMVAFPTQVTNLASSFVQMLSWVGEPKMGIETIVQQLNPQLIKYLNPSPWPNIHEQARLAKVPILMYHDILPEKEVFFDVTPEELELHLEQIKENGLTPIRLDQLVTHLQTGLPLPEKPILLTFDDAYGGHYEYVYPLLKKYGYPAVFSIYTSNIGIDTGRTHVTWEQLRQMAADPLVTIVSHSVSHPRDLRELPDDKLQKELVESKRLLEAQLGIPIRYFSYPEGKYDQRVASSVQAAGYEAALTMNDAENVFAGQSENLLAIGRIGQSNIEYAIASAWGGQRLPNWYNTFDFKAPIEQTETTIDDTTIVLISGGRPITIHAKSRYQLSEILAGTDAVAGVDGGFFSLKFLDSNVMIGPVLSQSENQFIPGNRSDNPKLNGRPLVLISPQAVIFTPFNPLKHNTLAGIQAEIPQVRDAFVAAAWLVKNNQPQPASSFGSLFDFDATRHRAFWGINQAGQPTIGVSKQLVDSVSLGKILAKAGFRDAVMLDSGASTSLVYKGESLVGYVPRPVPHAVALVSPESTVDATCVLAAK